MNLLLGGIILNVAFFLLPKKDVIYLKNNSTMRQALERMKYHRHSAIPIINDDGKYVDTLTEDDLLWAKKNTPGLTFKNTEKIHLDEIKRHTQNRAVSVNAQMENLIVQGVERNFIPVVDDNGIFIGIVRRSELISYSVNYINPFRHFTTAKIKRHFSENTMMRSLCFSNEHEALIFSGESEQCKLF